MTVEYSSLLIVAASIVFFCFGWYMGLRKGLEQGQLLILAAIPMADRESTLERAAQLLEEE
jgi:hypothetical protein